MENPDDRTGGENSRPDCRKNSGSDGVQQRNHLLQLGGLREIAPNGRLWKDPIQADALGIVSALSQQPLAFTQFTKTRQGLH